MNLLTKDLLKRFEEIGSQEQDENPIVIAKFFNPTGLGTWYATEYNPETKIFYGYANIFKGEWGEFSLEELENFMGPLSIGIERDLYFPETRFKDIK